MSSYQFNGSVYISQQFELPTSSTQQTFIGMDGDTIRICSGRNPASSDLGYLGELTFGTVGGISYLYYYNGSNWVRTPMLSY